MKRLRLIFISFFFATAPFFAFASSSVVINEIAWMGSISKNGETSSAAASNEWIELKNTGNESINLEGWFLSAEDGMPSFSLTGIIPAGGFFLLERTDDNTVLDITADVIYTGALSNSGETLILKDRQGNIIDTVDAASGWPAGSADTKETMQKAGQWITAPATPHAENVSNGSLSIVPINSATPTPSSSISPSPTHSSTPSSAPSTVSSQAFAKTIKAYAGEDSVAFVGVSVEFLGHVKGLNDEPIDSSARFFWNFGDGETREGRSVAHVYRIPGIYTASVHVSSGEYAASDVARIEVRPNKITISKVISGSDGYIRFVNNSDIEADIGGWNVRDGAGHNFFMPAHTILARRADIAIANSVSGLLSNAAAIPITIFYPNGTQALVSGEVSTPTSSAHVAVAIASPSLVPTPDVPRMVTIISSPTLSILPSPAPSTAPLLTADTAYAASGYSAISFSFGIAAVISAIGAAGFFVSKKYF